MRPVWSALKPEARTGLCRGGGGLATGNNEVSGRGAAGGRLLLR